MNIRAIRLCALLSLLSLAGCDQSAPPAAWPPIPGGPVSVTPVAGFSIAVSQLPASDVSAFALQFDQAVVVWVRAENFRDERAVINPAAITLAANGAPLPAYALDKSAVSSKNLQTVTRALASSYKSLSSGKPSKSDAGRELQTRWNESPGSFERIDDVLLPAATLAPGESVEGYVIFAFQPAAGYVLTVPAGSDRHAIRMAGR